MAGNLSAFQQSNFLAGVDLFKHLPESCLDLLVKDSRVLDCAAGHLFFQAGGLGNSLFILEEGHVRIFRSYGDEEFIALRPGSSVSRALGDLSLIVLTRGQNTDNRRKEVAAEFAALSTIGMVIAEHSNHVIHMYRPKGSSSSGAE
jgi:hypothetical protein